LLDKQGKDLVLAFVAVTFAEFINLTGSIHNLLFTRKEWMALRAYIDTHSIIAICGACNKGIPTAAGYVNFLVIWMYVCFHDDSFSVEPADHTQHYTPTQGVTAML